MYVYIQTRIYAIALYESVCEENIICLWMHITLQKTILGVCVCIQLRSYIHQESGIGAHLLYKDTFDVIFINLHTQAYTTQSVYENIGRRRVPTDPKKYMTKVKCEIPAFICYVKYEGSFKSYSIRLWSWGIFYMRKPF